MTDTNALELDRRRTILFAARGFLQLRHQPPEVAPLRRWLDSWTGIGAVITGMLRQGFDVDLRSYSAPADGNWAAGPLFADD